MTIKEQREKILENLPEEEREKRKFIWEQSDIKVGKMRTRFKVHFSDLKLEQSMDMLSYMCEKHSEQLRKNGELYIQHPLSMACDFQAMRRLYDDERKELIFRDNMFASILGHDILEESAPPDRKLLDSEVPKLIADIPAGDTAKGAIRLMTLSSAYPNEPNSETKRRYYQRFIDDNRPENKVGLLCKGLDRRNNLSTIINLSPRAIRKNVLETSVLLLPIMKEAKSKWPREANLIFPIRTCIKDLNNLLAYYNNITNLGDAAELYKLLDDPEYLKDLS